MPARQPEARTAVPPSVRPAEPAPSPAPIGPPHGPRLHPSQLLQLQRTVGNRAVGRMLAATAPAGAPTVQRALSHDDQSGVGFGSRRGTGGRVAAAWMRTDGSLAGNVPQADPPGYDYIRQLQLTNFWIRFHLVNNLAGGPGTAANLVPASKRDNSQYETAVEADVKESVDDLAMTDDEIFFGVEVAYDTAAAGTQTQRDAAPFFPTEITYYHEKYDGDDDEWSWISEGETFDFTDAQPDHPGASIALSAVTAQQLRQRVYNYAWTGDDVAFIRSLGGSRQQEFEDLIEQNAGAGPAGSAAAALNDIDYSAMVTFGERIGDENAIDALGAAIGRGFLTIG